MITTAGIITNRERDEAVACEIKAAAFFQRNGIRVIDPLNNENGIKPDVLITFGGDGTLLIGARYAMQYDVPLLGINLGTVGFLTEAEPENLDDALKAILESDYHIEKRSILHVLHPGEEKEYYAFNDVVVTRGGYARLIRVETTVNGQSFGTFTADGIIIATPTGSTGYSLSAGGPIVEPGMSCMIITPVCAHSLQHCPCIVSDTSEISIGLASGRKHTAELQIDGVNMGQLEEGDRIFARGTDKKIRLIRLRDYDFFSLVHRKLTEWGS